MSEGRRRHLVIVLLFACYAVLASAEPRIAIVYFDTNGLAKSVAEKLAEGLRGGGATVDVFPLELVNPPRSFIERVRAWWWQEEGTAADLRGLPSVAAYDQVWLGTTAAGLLGRDAPWPLRVWAAAHRNELVQAGAVSGFVVQGRWTDPDAILAEIAQAGGVELLNNFHVPVALVPKFDPGMLLIRSEWKFPPSYKDHDEL